MRLDTQVKTFLYYHKKGILITQLPKTSWLFMLKNTGIVTAILKCAPCRVLIPFFILRVSEQMCLFSKLGLTLLCVKARFLHVVQVSLFVP